MLRRDLTHALLLPFVSRPPQYAKSNLADNFGYLGELDLDEVYDKHDVDLPNGTQIRNMCYYHLMKSSGVLGAPSGVFGCVLGRVGGISRVFGGLLGKGLW